jgi:uncharacterized membrane protein YjjP (DUF1212 family)
MHDIQRRQADIVRFQNRINQIQHTTDRDVIRQLAYQMSSAGILPRSTMSLVSLIIYFSPSTAMGMLRSAINRATRI